MQVTSSTKCLLSSAPDHLQVTRLDSTRLMRSRKGLREGSRAPPASHSRPVNIICKIADNCLCDEEVFIMTFYFGHLYSDGDSSSSPATKLPR